MRETSERAQMSKVISATAEMLGLLGTLIGLALGVITAVGAVGFTVAAVAMGIQADFAMPAVGIDFKRTDHDLDLAWQLLLAAITCCALHCVLRPVLAGTGTATQQDGAGEAQPTP